MPPAWLRCCAKPQAQTRCRGEKAHRRQASSWRRGIVQGLRNAPASVETLSSERGTMIPYWLKSTVEAFWAGAGEMEPYPRRLEQAVSWALPLAIAKVPRLCMKDVAARLAASGVDFGLHTPQRELHGCLVAFGGRGLVMLDGTDSTDEMRFSLAHEVGHFLIDYFQPRERAVRRLGDGVIDVLDGLRAPPVSERIDAILNEVDVGVHMHLMGRPNS